MNSFSTYSIPEVNLYISENRPFCLFPGINSIVFLIIHCVLFYFYDNLKKPWNFLLPSYICESFITNFFPYLYISLLFGVDIPDPVKFVFPQHILINSKRLHILIEWCYDPFTFLWFQGDGRKRPTLPGLHHWRSRRT